jgi:hypothetical protein
MTQPAEIHPKILKMRSRIAHLINLVQPTFLAEGNTLGELYRVAVDSGVDLQNDKELGYWYEEFCDYHDQYDIDAVSSQECALEKVCPPLARWLAEGMSPVIYFTSRDTSSVNQSLFYDVLRSTHFKFSAHQLLGPLKTEEFCGYFADYLNFRMADLPKLRKIVAVLPEIINPVYWHNYTQAHMTVLPIGSSAFEINQECKQWLPLLILDHTNNEAMYRQAVAFFNPEPTLHLFKKLFGDGHTPEDISLIDKVINLSYGGWGSQMINDMIPYLLPPLPFNVIRLQTDEVKGENVDYLDFMIDKALVAIEQNNRVFWPVCLLTDALLKNCGGLHSSSSTDEKRVKLTRLLKQHPSFDGIIGHLRTLAPQDLNFRDCDIYNVQNQTIFIDLLTPEQKAGWVPTLARKLAQSFKFSMQGDQWPHSLEKSKLMLEHIHQALIIDFSEQLRSIVKFPSAYKEAKTMVWLQTLSLKGPDSAGQALAFCHSLNDPALKVAAAVELGIDPVTLNASGEEAALYLESDLGL